MTHIDSLQRDISALSEELLSDLSSEERVRSFVTEAAEGNDEFLQQLADTTPKGNYTLRDP